MRQQSSHPLIRQVAIEPHPGRSRPQQQCSTLDGESLDPEQGFLSPLNKARGAPMTVPTWEVYSVNGN
jgi:hypothetical protein